VSEQSEAYRQQMLRELQMLHIKGDPPEVREAERVIGMYRSAQAQRSAQIMRLDKPLPEPDLCPNCWFMQAVRHRLVAAHNQSPYKHDSVTCARCNYVPDQNAGP